MNSEILDTLPNIPARLISELRRMATEHMDPTSDPDASVDFDPQTNRDSRAAMSIMSGLPMAGGVMTGPDTILSLVHNPENEENREYIKENRALLRAFPILKQIYGFEKEISNSDWKGYDRLQEEQEAAVEDAKSMFGEDTLPRQFTKKGRLEQIEERIKELGPLVEKEDREFFNPPPITPKKTDPSMQMDEVYPTPPDAPSLGNLDPSDMKGSETVLKDPVSTPASFVEDDEAAFPERGYPVENTTIEARSTNWRDDEDVAYTKNYETHYKRNR